jgi:TRAP-type mannitol/chloroaromatic compound transport system permease small subunit
MKARRLRVSTDALLWAAWIESRLDRLTSFVSWIWLALIALIVLTVVMRYVFGSGRIEFEELEWHLYAVGFLMGIVACASHDRHVRVDVFRERMMPRTRAWVDLYGILLFQIPFLALVLWSALPFVADSFAVGERSSAAGGLPYRWVLKTFLPMSMLLLSVATGARLLRVFDSLFGPAAPRSAK